MAFMEPIISHIMRRKAELEPAAALAHRFMLQAITLHATAKHTLAHRRTRNLPKAWLRFNSEMVASIPERIL
jgi:hypothetical protein